MLYLLAIEFAIDRKLSVTVPNQPAILPCAERSAAAQHIDCLEQAGFAGTVAPKEIVTLRVKFEFNGR